MPTYPDKLEIVPLAEPPQAQRARAGSKSITNRALVLAALSADGHRLRLAGVLRSEDTEVMVDGLRALGFRRAGRLARMRSIMSARDVGRAVIPAATADLFVANSGTTMRFLTALVSLGHGRYRLDGVPRMRERPIEDLLDALRQLGVKARSESGNGCPPVVVEADGLARRDASAFEGDVSSQFLSGLLMAAPSPTATSTIEVDGPLVSEPYVDDDASR